MPLVWQWWSQGDRRGGRNLCSNYSGTSFQYLRILSISEGIMERRSERLTGAALELMLTTYRSTLVEEELNRKPKFSVHLSIYVLTQQWSHR